MNCGERSFQVEDPDSIEKYRRARRASGKAVAEAKARAWEVVVESTEKDVHVASKIFRQTTLHHIGTMYMLY